MMNFKEAKLALQKEKNELLSKLKKNDSSYIKNSEVIKQKIEENNSFLGKKTKNEDELSNDEFNKIRNENVTNLINEKDTCNKDDKDIPVNEVDTKEELNNNIENTVKKVKEYIVTVKPEEIIKEVYDLKEQEVRRVINVDIFTKEFKSKELYNWFHLMFIEWEKDLDKMPIEIKMETEGREKIGNYKQCRGYIKPLLKALKSQEASNEIVNKLFEVMVFLLDKDYIKAHDRYIELAIGNSPWPMGVTMVGIHERSGRSKIYKSQVAHILNDENTKKYLQSVKRIMSLVQKLNPLKPSFQVVS